MSSDPRSADSGRGIADRVPLGTALWALGVIRAAAPRLLAGLLALSLVQGLLPAGLALALRGLIDAAVATIGGTGSTAPLMPWLAFAFALAAIEALSSPAAVYLNQRLVDELNLRVTRQILTHATSLDLAFFEDPERQDLIARTQSNVAVHLQIFVIETLSAARNLLGAAGLLAVLAAIEPLVLLIVPPFALPFLWFQWRLAKRRYAEHHQRAGKLRWTAYFVSTMTSADSVAELKLLDLGPLLTGRFDLLLTEFRNRDRGLHRRNLWGTAVAALLTITALYLLFARVALLTAQGAASLGDLAVFGGAAVRLRVTLNEAVRAAASALERVLFVANLREFLEEQPRIPPTMGRTPRLDRGAIEIRGVGFRYPGASQPVLRDLWLSLHPGETVALVGDNGAGKTTLVKLLTRLYDPDEGSILFDGVDLREIAPEHLHRRIGVVLQLFGRYEASAAENLGYGDWRRLLEDREEIERLARAVSLHGAIERLGGYDTHLGRRFGHATLSGGEWQRLAVARAFARQSSLLILDEPTANLDARAEYELYTQFKELAAGRTTLLISHRFTTISLADRVAVLSDGRIVETGSHADLVGRGGAYAALYGLYAELIPEGGTMTRRP